TIIVVCHRDIPGARGIIAAQPRVVRRATEVIAARPRVVGRATIHTRAVPGVVVATAPCLGLGVGSQCDRQHHRGSHPENTLHDVTSISRIYLPSERLALESSTAPFSCRAREEAKNR